MLRGDAKSVSFTKEQFRMLLRIVYLGNWLANATRDGSSKDPRLAEFDEIEDYIFSQSREFGLAYLVEREKNDERWFPTRGLEESLEAMIEGYDEETFWEELFHRLSDRDFFRAFSEDEVRHMALRERFEKEEPFRRKWNDEISEHGVERFEAVERPRLSPLRVDDL